jgi:hypothetical protein
VGSQRSGTTVFSELLGRHPSLLLTVNGKMLYYLITWMWEDGKSAGHLHPRLDEIAYSLGRKWIGGISIDQLNQMKRTLLSELPPEVIHGKSAEAAIREVFLRVYAAANLENRLIGDKYNEYLLQLDKINAIFPECRFIFIHRDPFDVAESMIRRFGSRPWCPRSYDAALSKWTAWNMEWLRYRQRVTRCRYLEIEYADLIARPEETFNRAFEFLGIDQDTGVLEAASQTLTTDRAGLGKSLRMNHTAIAHLDFQAVCAALGYEILLDRERQAVFVGAETDDEREQSHASADPSRPWVHGPDIPAARHSERDITMGGNR